MLFFATTFNLESDMKLSQQSLSGCTFHYFSKFMLQLLRAFSKFAHLSLRLNLRWLHESEVLSKLKTIYSFRWNQVLFKTKHGNVTWTIHLMVHKLLGESGVRGTSLLEVELLETSIQFSFLYFPPGTQLMSKHSGYS